MTHKILIVDDEPNVLSGLQRLLHRRRKEWNIYFAPGVTYALEMLNDIDFDVIISDISMPGKDGFDLLSSIRSSDRTRDLPVLMLTGLDDQDLKKRALEQGADDLITKPARKEELMARINSMLRLKKYQDALKDRNARLQEKIRERTAELERARLDLVCRLGSAAEFRHRKGRRHVLRVGYFSRVIAEGLGSDRAFTERIFVAAPLHDIGKLGIPEKILFKRGKLSPDEKKIMRRHCAIGADMLRHKTLKQAPPFTLSVPDIPPEPGSAADAFAETAANIALTHHERWDGTGYPGGIRGEEIPMESRIVAVADTYDTLRAHPAYTAQKALDLMRTTLNPRFDPAVFSAFEKSLEQLEEIRSFFADRPGT